MLRSRTASTLALASMVLLAGPGRARAATVSVKPGAGTLQAALDAAHDGDVLVLKAGTYTGGGFRTGINNLTIRGVGKVIVDGTGVAGTNGGTLDFIDVHGLKIRGITIRNAKDDGIYLANCSAFSISGCTIENPDDSGIEDNATDGFVVDRCKFVKCSWGLALGYGGLSTKATVKRSQFLQSSTYGVDLHASQALLSGNTFSSGHGTAVQLRIDVSGARVEGNRLTSVKGIGISAQGQGDRIVRNVITNTVGNSIELQGGGGHTADRNVVTRCHANGILVASTGNTLTHNNVTGSGGAGGAGGFDLNSTGAKTDDTYTANHFGTKHFDKP